jgi:hypothetical protein
MPWIQLRREVGAYHAVIRELEPDDQRRFKNFPYSLCQDRGNKPFMEKVNKVTL